ncbi:C-X-C chemokine receptor type 3-2-like [Ambystoma mexicanum]|uniref:C-X-C chemokine receptor type 3-2-like n=1 Tax=Ambystoma mexicanum TaxID=8296 RepID=UPI0037E9C194
MDELGSSYEDADYYGSDYFNSTYYPEPSDDAAPCTTESISRFNAFFIPIVFSLVFVMGLLGNGFVLLILSIRKCHWHLADHYLLHLALADLLLCLTLPFWITQFAYTWVFGRIPCKLVGALFTINMYSTVFFLACISMDRYLAIIHAVDLYRKQRPIHTHLTCACIWCVCLAFSGVDIYFKEVQFFKQAKAHFCHDAFSAINADKWRIALRLTNMSLGFVVPLLVMIFCYGNIFRSLYRSNLFAKHKPLKVIVVLLLVFVICWAPYNVFLLVDSLQRLGYIQRNCYLEKVLDFGATITESLGLAHCCLNPIIYAFIGDKFRKELGKLFRKSKSQSQSPNVTVSNGNQSTREKSLSSTAEQQSTAFYSTLM